MCLLSNANPVFPVGNNSMDQNVQMAVESVQVIRLYRYESYLRSACMFTQVRLKQITMANYNLFCTG